MSEKILRRPVVEEKTGKSRSSIYDGIENNTFPAPIKIGPRAVGWLESEVDQWIEDKINESRARGV